MINEGQQYERRVMKMWEVEYYETESGKKPAYGFINDLPLKMRAKAFKEMELLEEFGTNITMPYSKPMQDGVYELRIQAASDISRVFYFFFTGRKIILTNGYIKKSQKTPALELNRALEYKADYERRFSR
jgi:phage-related protein